MLKERFNTQDIINAATQKVNTKVYDLLPPSFLDRLVNSPKPVYTEEPFFPPGHEISVTWEISSPQSNKDFQVEKEGEYSSKRLVRAGRVWYLKEYFNVDGSPYRVAYGPKHEDENLSVYHRAFKAWAEEDYEGNVFEEEIAEISAGEKPVATSLTAEERLLRKKQNRAVTKQKFRELVNANNMQYMFTFTFAIEPQEKVKGLRFFLPLDEQKDRKKVFHAWNNRLTVIRKKLNEQGQNFKYVLVAEQHTGQKSQSSGGPKVGTFHFHLATDQYIDIHSLQEWWGYGMVRVTNFAKPHKGKRKTKVTDPGLYMCKYMEKDIENAKLHNMRAYTCSQNLIRPIPERDEETVEECLTASDAECYTVFDACYKAEYSPDKGNNDLPPVTFFVRSRIFNFNTAKKVFLPQFNLQTMLDKLRNTS